MKMIVISLHTSLFCPLWDQCPSLVVILKVLLSLLCRPAQFSLLLSAPPHYFSLSFPLPSALVLSSSMPSTASIAPLLSAHWCWWWLLSKLWLTMTHVAASAHWQSALSGIHFFVMILTLFPLPSICFLSFCFHSFLLLYHMHFYVKYPLGAFSSLINQLSLPTCLTEPHFSIAKNKAHSYITWPG